MLIDLLGWLVPSTLSTGVSAAQTAYVTSWNYTNYDYVNLNEGTFTSAQVNTWSPGLYYYDNLNFEEGSTVQFTGAANDYWVVNVAGNVNVGNNVKFVGAEGAAYTNTVFAVAGNAYTGTNAVV